MNGLIIGCGIAPVQILFYLCKMRTPSIAPAYAFLYPLMCEAARECGYALALHGTMARDLDVVAIPWVEDAQEPDDVLVAIMRKIDGYVIGSSRENPTQKPHGRIAWSIHIDGGVFIDLSVMPRLIKDETVRHHDESDVI